MALRYPVKPLPHKRENKEVFVVDTKPTVQVRLLHPWSPVACQWPCSAQFSGLPAFQTEGKKEVAFCPSLPGYLCIWRNSLFRKPRRSAEHPKQNAFLWLTCQHIQFSAGRGPRSASTAPTRFNGSCTCRCQQAQFARGLQAMHHRKYNCSQHPHSKDVFERRTLFFPHCVSLPKLLAQ